MAAIQKQLSELSSELASKVQGLKPGKSGEGSPENVRKELLKASELQKATAEDIKNDRLTDANNSAKESSESIREAIQELDLMLGKEKVSGAAASELTGDYERLIKEYTRRLSYEK